MLLNVMRAIVEHIAIISDAAENDTLSQRACLGTIVDEHVSRRRTLIGRRLGQRLPCPPNIVRVGNQTCGPATGVSRPIRMNYSWQRLRGKKTPLPSRGHDKDVIEGGWAERTIDVQSAPQNIPVVS